MDRLGVIAFIVVDAESQILHDRTALTIRWINEEVRGCCYVASMEPTR